MNRAIFGFLVIVAACLPLCGSEIRVSLLTDDRVLDETATLLRENGSSSESVAAFKKAVHIHKTDLLDTTKFPKPESGLYSFKNVAELSHALPDPFCEKVRTNDIYHNSLTCLDMVVLLIKDADAKAPLLRKDFANKHFGEAESITNSIQPDFKINPISSPDFYMDGHPLLYPTNGYSWITGLARSSDEVDLAISLKANRLLPGKFVDTDAAIKELFSDWTKLQARDGLQFPKKLKIVFCGYVVMKYHHWVVDHVAVCFEHEGKIIYVEKNGPSGPFVRVDFNDEKELAEFAAAKLLPDANKNNIPSTVFVAINHRLIRIARP